jgi:type I restriction enzyme S subunit
VIIARIIDTLDSAIQQTEALIAKMQQVKTGLMHDLFTRGILPNGELRPQRDEASQLYKESPLGSIPKEWEVATIEQVSEMVTSGPRGWAAFYAKEGPLFIRIGNLTRENPNMDLQQIIHVRPPLSAEGLRTRLAEGDLLVSITADIGITGVVPPDLGESYINQHIALVRPKRSLEASRWLGHFLSGSQAQAGFRRLNDSGAKAGLNLPAIRRFPVVLPRGSEREYAVKCLDFADKVISCARNEVSKARLHKSGLMQDLLTGRVRIPESMLKKAAATT